MVNAKQICDLCEHEWDMDLDDYLKTYPLIVCPKCSNHLYKHLYPELERLGMKVENLKGE